MITLFSRRVVAYLIDFFVVSAFMWIVSFLLYFIDNQYARFTIYSYFIYVVPILQLIYFCACEKVKGSTVGKALMYLKIVTVYGGSISWSQAFLRSLSKIYWFPIIFDLIIGKIFRKDRILVEITQTVVVDELNL